MKTMVTAPAKSSNFYWLNVWINPFVRMILRSPLHGLMSGALLLLTYRGPKSGKAYTLPVQYARVGNTFYIVPGAAEQKRWWRNLRGGAAVQLRVRGVALQALADVLSGSTDAGLDGAMAYFERFPAAAQARGLQRAADGKFMRDEVRATAVSLLIVRATVQ